MRAGPPDEKPRERSQSPIASEVVVSDWERDMSIPLALGDASRLYADAGASFWA